MRKTTMWMKIIRYVDGAEPNIQEPPICWAKDTLENPNYWLTPVKSAKDITSHEIIEELIGREGLYAFRRGNRASKRLKRGDYICFYSGQKGIVAHARISSPPQKESLPHLSELDAYPCVFRLFDVKLYQDDPLALDVRIRSRLDAFRNRDPKQPWAWFVLTTRKITKHDFNVLTQQTGLMPLYPLLEIEIYPLISIDETLDYAKEWAEAVRATLAQGGH